MRTRILGWMLLAGLWAADGHAAFDSAKAGEQKDLRILRVTPEGNDVPAGRQIVIEFNRPVVPIGKMARDKKDIPVAILPEVKCEWRWLNTSSLACQLTEKEALKEATKYELTMKPGIQAEDGTGLTSEYHHSFITARPDARYAWLKTWGAPGTPVLKVTFDQPVTKSSVEKHLFYALDKDGTRVAVKAEQDREGEEQPTSFFAPGEKFWLWFSKAAPKKNEEQPEYVSGEEARMLWVIAPVQEMPGGSSVTLKVEPGLVSSRGAERGAATKALINFATFPEFVFKGLKCRNNDDKDILVEPGKTAEGKCNPLGGVALMFSSPVMPSQAEAHLEILPDPTAGNKQVKLWGEQDYSRLQNRHDADEQYQLWVPSLKAAQEYKIQSRSSDIGLWQKAWEMMLSIFNRQPKTLLTDEFGRRLMDKVSVGFATDHRKPNFEIAHHTAVIEKAIDSEVPLYVNNLSKMIFRYNSLTAEGSETFKRYTKDFAQVQDVQFGVPFGIREMLNGKTGAVYGQLDTEPHVNKSESEYRMFGQVTPYQMHVKIGHFNTLVWVTDLASGEAVSGAKVSLYIDKLTVLRGPTQVLSEAVTDSQGLAVLAGTETIDPDLGHIYVWKDEEERFFIKAEKAGDMALLPIHSDFLLNSFRMTGDEWIYTSNRKKYGHMNSWGMTAQGVYRAGDTVQYKLFVRNQDLNSLIAAPKEGYTLEIMDPTGKVVETRKDLALSAFGGIDGEYTVPKEGAVGWYQFKLSASFGTASGGEEGEDSAENKNTLSWHPLRVLVSDFTPSPFKVTNHLNGDLFRPDQKVEVETQALLHSGGAYTDAAARITAMVEAKPFTTKNPAASGFVFGSYTGERDSQQVFQKMDKVNGKGELALSFALPKQNIYYGRMIVESAVQDDRGKYVVSTAQADVAGVDRLVGLKMTEWVYTAEKTARIQSLVVNERGVPVKDVPVRVLIEREVTKSARVKSAGNAYVTEFHNEWEGVGECKANSEEDANNCDFTPPEAGYYRATASVKDSTGAEHKTEQYLYVAGKGYVRWNESNDSNLALVPEKNDYHVGDTARVLVKNPYPGALALVTVERYGVLDKFVQKLEGSTPVISFPIKADYIPGFYVSVVITSPRVEKPEQTEAPKLAELDLGKPTFRIGYFKAEVKDKAKEMVVTAKADKEVYKPRDKVTVTLHAEPRQGAKQEPIELTVAVLDESVFDLITGGKAYFDPYDGFYKLDALDVRNYSLLVKLVGRQKFEKKGANSGGDGGSMAMRSLFKFVSYWNASLPADDKGNATVSFDAPDNLTGWRILAIAATPTDRFGLGDANFKVNRPTEVRPVMPNQVVEGDSFTAGFSVMNRTDKKRDIAVTITAEGDLDDRKSPATHTETVSLEAYKRVTVSMPVQTKTVKAERDHPRGEIRFTAKAQDAEDGDGMTHTVVVNKRRSLEVAANYGTTEQEKAEESIAFPEGIAPDVGEVSVVLSPSVIGNVAGAFTYMRDYPYLCWEQSLTKGVMAAQYQALKGYMPADFVWKDSEKLPEEMLGRAAQFQAPNGGMTYFLAQDRYVDSYLSAYTALAFTWMRKEGHTPPEAVEKKLQEYLATLLKKESAPSWYSEGMVSSVRAVALAALAEREKATLDDVLRYQAHVPKMSLFGKAHYLQAALKFKGATAVAREAAKMILAQSNQTGGKFMFSETLDDGYTRILATPLRDNCAVLSALSAYGETVEGKELVGDVPFKLVRTITQTRGSRDHWENTQENMFCMNALAEYSRIYESTPPVMTVKAALDGTGFGEASFKALRDPAITLARPIQNGDVGRKATVSLTREGQGRVYYATRLSYAPTGEFAKPTNAGIEVTREYSLEKDGKWTLLKNPMEIARGDLVRVDLYLSLPAARNFVVVDDPVPGGLEPVNRDLATASVIDDKKGEFKAAGGSWWFKYSDWSEYNVGLWSFYHQELRFDAARFFADYLPAGNYHLSYTAQAVAPGNFAVMPVMAQEMYDPDVYGKGVSEVLVVK